MRQDALERLQSCCDRRAEMLLAVSDQRDGLRFENERLRNVVRRAMRILAGVRKVCPSAAFDGDSPEGLLRDMGAALGDERLGAVE